VNSDPARGELREGDARYLLIRDDSLMGIFQRLAEPARSEALRAFAESVAQFGGCSAARYAIDGPTQFLGAVAAKAGELGWGEWRFSRESAGELVLEVRNSPFAHGHGPSAAPVCAAITGMLRAVGAHVFDAPAESEESACAASGEPVCRFVVRRGRIPP